MTIGYFEALAGIALSLSILTAMAWTVQQRTGNSGRVDTIGTFLVELTGAASRDPAGLRMGPGDVAGAGSPGAGSWSRHRHSVARGADAAFARRALSRLPVAYFPFFPLPPHKGVVT